MWFEINVKGFNFFKVFKFSVGIIWIILWNRKEIKISLEKILIKYEL